ncbi:MAG: glycosyltransferase family 2 protein [Eubacteriales bacterium]|nr:glycosyltransferase family 2 protein [Eubacteriales bacterium]
MKKVLVIIPNYNKKILLQNCIRSLLNSNYQFDVLIIDNGSSDGSIDTINEIVKENENFHSILSDSNQGFAIASNKGLKFSINHQYDYSILLNNDTEVDKNFVRELVNAIEKNKNFFSASSFMINYNHREIADDCGDGYNIFGYAFQINNGLNINEIKHPYNIFSSCGGASIFNNNILKKIGLFDEYFFAYLEDIDLCYRAKLYGYKNVHAKNAKCYHIGSATSGSKYNEFKVRLSSRNNIFLIYKNMPFIQIVINLPFIFFGTLLKQIYFIKKGFGMDYFFGICDALKDIKNIKKNNFQKINISRLIFIQIELIINTIYYILQYLKRQIK